MRLAGKVAIVTGGGSGFGEAIAKRFAEEGAKLIVNDINDEGGTRVAKEIDGAQGQGSATYLRADVASDSDMAKLIAAALDRYGHIDIMVNNAGITHVNRPMLEVGEQEFDRIYAVNVKSIYLSARYLVPVLRTQGTGGCIINTASTAGIRPRPAERPRRIANVSLQPCRLAGSRPRKTWRTPPSTSLPTRPSSSPASRSRSMAAAVSDLSGEGAAR
jgi:3-oxoacyl-[acyl-carrier protein] reductase